MQIFLVDDDNFWMRLAKKKYEKNDSHDLYPLHFKPLIPTVNSLPFTFEKAETD